ncbi:MAG: ribosome assembly RNA-binding protein YhbY [Eubacteriales bacterium]|nr:ribosome assembly RNA-binding protein YhbY [Eubacteriales bacterium]
MITSKQRAYLRSLANSLQPVFIIGKEGVTEETIKQLALVLEARELIKVKILETALLDTKECGNDIAVQLDADCVQAIGNKFVLFKRAIKKENHQIKFPSK